MVRGLFLSLLAAVAIPARSLVAVDENGGVKVATSNADVIIGVSDDVDVDAGQVASVQVSGTAEVVYSAATLPGQYITASAAGLAAVGTGRVVGVALHAGIAGDIGEVLIQPANV